MTKTNSYMEEAEDSIETETLVDDDLVDQDAVDDVADRLKVLNEIGVDEQTLRASTLRALEQVGGSDE